MAITTNQRKQIMNWINSNEFEPVLNEIIKECIFCAEVYFHLRSQGIDNRNLIEAEGVVFGYVSTFIQRPSSKNNAESKKYDEVKKFIVDKILNKYGSLLYRKINEHLKIKNLQTDF